MSIEFRCESCREILTVPDEAVGRQARCPKCGAMMPIPAGTDAAPPPPFYAIFSAAEASSPLPDSAELPPLSPPQRTMAAAAEGPFECIKMDVNPYASPAMLEDGFQQATERSARPARMGLPWETPPRSLDVWIQTAKLVLFSPSDAFSRMKIWGGCLLPFLFALIGGMFSFWGLMLLGAIYGMLLLGNLPRNFQDVVAGLLGGGTVIVLLSVLVVPFTIAIGLAIVSGVHHLALKLVGAAKHDFEVTFRVSAFAYGATAWILFIPCLGPFAFVIWAACATSIGFAKTHETSMGKAIFVALAPWLASWGAATLPRLFWNALS